MKDEKWVVGIDALCNDLTVCDSRPAAVRALERIGGMTQTSKDLVARFLDERSNSVVIYNADYSRWGWIYPAKVG